MSHLTTYKAIIITVVMCIILVFSMAIIPQSKSHEYLKEICRLTDNAIEECKSAEKVDGYLRQAKKILYAHETLFHFLYHHDYITNVEVALLSAEEISKHPSEDVSQLVSELCALKSAATVLIEMDNLTWKSLI